MMNDKSRHPTIIDLDHDVKLYHIPNFIKENDANILLDQLAKLPFMEFKSSGRKVLSLGRSYYYSGVNHPAYPFDVDTLALISLLSDKCNTDFNQCLLNWYPKDAVVGIGKHSDDERDLVDGSMVASVSLGAACTFIVCDDKKSWEFDLQHGDLFIMGHNCQKYYKHMIRYTKMVDDRISLTFREFKK